VDRRAVMGKPDVQSKIDEYLAEPKPAEAVSDLRDVDSKVRASAHAAYRAEMVTW
jgi:hypothetical protein